MKIWIYRPDYRVKNINYNLLYYREKTYPEYLKEKETKQIKIVKTKIKPHFVEVPYIK